MKYVTGISGDKALPTDPEQILQSIIEDEPIPSTSKCEHIETLRKDTHSVKKKLLRTSLFSNIPSGNKSKTIC